MKFTFKKDIKTGRYKSFENNYTDIKLNKKVVGHIKQIDHRSEYKIMLAIKKEKTERDPALFKWISLKKTFEDEKSARELIKKYEKEIQENMIYILLKIKRRIIMDSTTVEIKNPENYFVQPKLNGVFGRWDGKNLYTSGDNIITSVPHINKELKGKGPTEGELYRHGVSLQKLCSLVLNSSKIDKEKIVMFYEFKKIPYSEAKTNEELKKLYDKYLKNGYEGAVLTHKETGKQYKIKPEPDGEATLIGFTPAKGARNKATFGSLILQLDNGVVFKAGGIKDVDREMLWRTKPIGCRINFKYWELSDGGVPKMAKYQYIRTDKRGGL